MCIFVCWVLVAQLCSPAHSCCVLLACVLLLCLLPLFFFSSAALLLSPQQAAPSVSVFNVCGLCVLCACVWFVRVCVRVCPFSMSFFLRCCLIRLPCFLSFDLGCCFGFYSAARCHAEEGACVPQQAQEGVQVQKLLQGHIPASRQARGGS